MSDAAVKGANAGANAGSGAGIRRRPKYLSLPAILFEIRLPPSALVSILHRISGALLFVALLWLLWMLDRSLSSEASFERIRHYLSLWPVKLAMLALIWAYLHHLFAGVRHLFLDLDRGLEKETASKTAYLTLAAAILLTALIGWRIW